MKNLYHICYVHIYSYRILKDVDLIFDHHYDFKYDKNGKKLKISRKSNIPNDFWGEGIYSVSGLFGNNGAGKSTVFSFLMDALVDGANAVVNGLIVYENNAKLYIFNPRELKIENDDDIEYKCINKTKKINTFYYSGLFKPEQLPISATDNEFTGSYNASKSFRLKIDRQNYLNDYDPAGLHPLSEYLSCHIAQTHHRICTLLSNSKLRAIFKEFVLPKYVVISINYGGFIAFRREKDLYDQVKFIANVFDKNENDTLSLFIYHNLLNVIHDCYPKSQWKEQLSKGIFKSWHNLPKGDNVLKQFREYILSSGTDVSNNLLSIYDALNQLRQIAKYVNPYSKGFYYVPIEEFHKLEKFIQILRHSPYLTSRYFNLNYAQSINDNSITVLSSGEQDLLNLFSLIYDAVILNPGKFANANTTTLFLLDEAENTFHPEWQQRYMNSIFSFFNSLKRIQPDLNFQIILTSHSPILLSDFPSECVNYLKFTEEGVVNDRIAMENTFAQNIFLLYRNSFFLKNGLIGEFARKKITEIENEIEQECDNDLLKKIDLINDERIHEYLLSKYFKIHPFKGIEYYKEKIRQLEDRSNE